MKTFIFENIGEIKGLKPITTAKNEYGTTINFYLIGKSEIKILKEYVKENTEYKNCISEPKTDFLKWFINRWAVAIVDNSYRLNRFLSKDNRQKLDTFTNVTVV